MNTQTDRNELMAAAIEQLYLSPDEATRAAELLASDEAAAKEVALLSALRNTLRERKAAVQLTVPTDLERRIRIELGNEVSKADQAAAPSLGLAARFVAALKRPLVGLSTAVGIAAVAIVAFTLLNKQQVVQKFELTSATYSNFSSIVRGELKVAHASSDTADLSKFFRESGVSYAVFYPQVDAQLVGGVVSKHDDLAFAHLVYAQGEHLVYLFEVDEESITNGNVGFDANVAQDVAKSRWHWQEKSGVGTLFVWKSNSVMCSAVSDLRTQEFSALFRLETL